jgi:hypothetical protein
MLNVSLFLFNIYLMIIFLKNIVIKYSAIDRLVTKTPKEMIDWVVATMRDVKFVLEKVNLNGFVYDASFKLHHKKPGTSVMQHNLKKVGGGSMTAKKPTSAAALLLCNICGVNHTMNVCRRKGFSVTNPDVSVKLAMRGRTDAIATGDRVDQRSPSRIM